MGKNRRSRGPACRRDVRLDGIGAHHHGLRPEHGNLLFRRRHAVVLPRHRRPAAELSRLELRLHRRRDRRNRLCGERSQSEHPGRARRNHCCGRPLRGDRPRRAVLGHRMGREADAAGAHRCDCCGDRAQSGGRRRQGRLRLRLRYADRIGHGPCGGSDRAACARHGAAAAGASRRHLRLRDIPYLRQRLRPRQADRLFRRRGGAALWLAEIHLPGLHRFGDGADRAGRDRARCRKSRSREGDLGHDGTRLRSAARPRLSGRWDRRRSSPVSAAAQG